MYSLPVIAKKPKMWIVYIVLYSILATIMRLRGGGGDFEGLLGGNSGGGPSCFCANNFFARFFANKHLFVLHYTIYLYFVLLNLTKFEYQ